MQQIVAREFYDRNLHWFVLGGIVSFAVMLTMTILAITHDTQAVKDDAEQAAYVSCVRGNETRAAILDAFRALAAGVERSQKDEEARARTRQFFAIYVYPSLAARRCVQAVK